MKNSFYKTVTLLALLCSLIATPVWAIGKDEAKAQGLIGERSNGYLGAVKNPASAKVQALIDSINQKRRAAYKKGAAKAGVETKVFELRMGERLQQRAPSGHFIQLRNGKWKKK